MDELISHPSWLRGVPQDTPVTALSIPGTHNSCCNQGPLGFAKTQNLDLADQLDAGVRFFDIRLTHCQDNLCVHHDVVCTGKKYAEVLDIFMSFLGQYPSETILMSVKDEARRAPGKLSPGQFICKLPLLGEDDRSENTRSLEDTFKARTWEHIGDAPLFYNFAVTPPGGSDEVTGPAFDSETTVGEVRGKIVLLRRFEAGQGVGLDVSYWPENHRFRSAASLFYDVEDRYQSPGEDDKFDFVVSHLEEARRGNPKDLYITFSSAVDLTAHGYAKTINPRLNDYLKRSPPGRVGIIVMDFFEQPPELVSNVIKLNFTPEATGGQIRRATIMGGADPAA